MIVDVEYVRGFEVVPGWFHLCVDCCGGLDWLWYEIVLVVVVSFLDGCSKSCNLWLWYYWLSILKDRERGCKTWFLYHSCG